MEARAFCLLWRLNRSLGIARWRIDLGPAVAVARQRRRGRYALDTQAHRKQQGEADGKRPEDGKDDVVGGETGREQRLGNDRRRQVDDQLNHSDGAKSNANVCSCRWLGGNVCVCDG